MFYLWGSGTLDKSWFDLYKIKKLDIPSENADMSNEKEKPARLKLMVLIKN